MNNNLTTINQNNKQVLLKAKNLLNITNKILEKKDDGWIKNLWEWADSYNINDHNKTSLDHWEGFPRNKTQLLSLKKLTLEFYSIKIFPKELTNLINLEVLEFPWNSITKLPNEIKNLINLKRLTLGTEIPFEWNWKEKELDNFLNSTNCLTDLPETIYALKNLEELELGHTPKGDYEGFGNRLILISNKIKNLKQLKRLELDFNSLQTLPNSISYLKKLEHLSVSYNNLLSLPSSIILLTNINYLDLTGNSNLILNSKQKEWIDILRDNGAIIEIDNDLLDKKQHEFIDNDKIPF